jgi:membrane fusion protein, heavy metal efflux system
VALRYVRAFIVTILAGCATGCGGSSAPAEQPGEVEPIAVTRWTSNTELFAEYPPLVVGKTSRFAIHLTELGNFKPVTSGRIEVQLQGGAAPEVFHADGPSRPGIFGVDVRPSSAGNRTLVIALKSPTLADDHRIDGVAVHSDADAARKAAESAADKIESISFLKEQQWSMDFGTTVVSDQALEESIRVPAQIEPRPDGAADVVAPIDGRLVMTAAGSVGSPVSRGQELGRLQPRAAVPGDLPQLQRERAQAQAALDLAVRDRERATRLVAAGAAPQRRIEQAEAEENQARARLTAADAALAQYNAARTGSGASAAAGLFIVRSPIGGVIARRDATTGANVAAGAVLFRIVDSTNVRVVGQIPQADAGRARAARAAEVEIAGRPDRIRAGKPIAIGKVLEPESRTIPISFEFDNRPVGLAIGQAVSLHLLMARADPRPVVPASAIVDDAGRPIVFVQRGGETFERRAVTVGARSGDAVQILEGVKAGERVVATGAYLVRLASLSTQVPAHGHVH